MNDFEERYAQLSPAKKAEIDRLLAASTRPDFYSGTFAQQRAYMQDPARLKWSLCTRRAAKSYSVGLEMMDSAYNVEGSCLYIGLTRESAKRIMWEDVLKVINRRHKAGFIFNESSLVATSPRGSRIYLIGADSNEEEKKKALGQKYRKVRIDEAQAFTIDLRELVYGVLKPAVADYRGDIALNGTPGNLTKGFFHELTKGSRAGYVSPAHQREAGWSGHAWTTFDNPYMQQQWSEEIADLKKANPLVVETPWFRQNYLGEWVIEQDKLVYRFNSDRNVFDKLPVYAKGRWHWILGVDLGYNDPTAFVPMAYHDYDRCLYVWAAEKQKKMDITDVANRIRRWQAWLQKEYKDDFDRIIVDGANKQAVEEIKRRHSVPLHPADKTGKSDFIEVMNGEFIQAHIKLRRDSTVELQEEYAGLIWDERSADKGKREEHSNCENHACDAALYGWRYCYQYLSEKHPEEVREEDKMEAAMNKIFHDQQRMMGFEDEGVGDSSNWEDWAQ